MVRQQGESPRPPSEIEAVTAQVVQTLTAEFDYCLQYLATANRGGVEGQIAHTVVFDIVGSLHRVLQPLSPGRRLGQKWVDKLMRAGDVEEALEEGDAAKAAVKLVEGLRRGLADKRRRPVANPPENSPRSD